MCWDKGCSKFSKNPEFINKSNNEGYGCSIDPLSYGICFHEVTCTWYHWLLEPKEPFGNIYKITDVYNSHDFTFEVDGL